MISKIVNDFRNCLDCLYVTRGIPDKNVIILNDVKRHITILGLYSVTISKLIKAHGALALAIRYFIQ